MLKYLIISLLILSSLESFSQGFPLDSINFSKTKKIDYIMNFDLLTKIKSDTVDQEIPIKYILSLPYSVKNTIPNEYQLKLIPEGFNLKIESKGTDDVVLNYNKLSEENKKLKPEEIFKSKINIDNKGKVFEHIADSKFDQINDILKIINTYSTGMFLEMPENNPTKWMTSKPIEIESNGINLNYSSTISFDYVGEFEVQNQKFYRVNYKLENFKMDVSDEISAVFNRLMETFLDLSGYYLINPKNGFTYQNYTEGSIRTIMDLGEYEALLNPEQGFKKSNLLIFQIFFNGNSFLR